MLGQTALCCVGSNWPLTSFGTRQPNAAPTLCAPVGKNLPTRPMIRVSTPVSAGGNSIQLPWLYSPPRSTGSFFQVMRNRLAGSTSHRPTFFSRCLILFRHAARIAHLGERRQQNLPLAKALDRPRQDFFVDLHLRRFTKYDLGLTHAEDTEDAEKN